MKLTVQLLIISITIGGCINNNKNLEKICTVKSFQLSDIYENKLYFIEGFKGNYNIFDLIDKKTYCGSFNQKNPESLYELNFYKKTKYYNLFSSEHEVSESSFITNNSGDTILKSFDHKIADFFENSVLFFTYQRVGGEQSFKIFNLETKREIKFNISDNSFLLTSLFINTENLLLVQNKDKKNSLIIYNLKSKKKKIIYSLNEEFTPFLMDKREQKLFLKKKDGSIYSFNVKDRQIKFIVRLPYSEDEINNFVIDEQNKRIYFSVFEDEECTAYRIKY